MAIFLIRLILLIDFPLVKDEALYVEAIFNQMDKLSWNLTYFDQVVTWKPPVFFWVYALLLKPFANLNLPFEFIYRFPTIIFGTANALLVYLIVKKYSEERIALTSAAIYGFSHLTIYVDKTILIDSLNLMFILLGVYFYIEKSKMRNFVLGAFFTIIAFYTKLWLALFIPVVALGYYFEKDRKQLKNPIFLASLLAVVIAFLGYGHMVGKNFAQDLTIEQIIKDRILFMDPLQQLVGSSQLFFLLMNVWLAFGLVGFLKHWKENKTFSLWFLISLIPMFAGYHMPWYSLPAMVPFAFFSSIILLKDNGKIKMDGFFAIVIIILMASNFFIGWEQSQDIKNQFIGEKKAGEFIVMKENLRIIENSWAPSIVAYKKLTERKKIGKILDYEFFFLKDEEKLDKILNNSFKREEFDEDIMCIFANTTTANCNYRKNTNLSRVDYLVLVGFNKTEIKNYKLINEWNEISIFKKR